MCYRSFEARACAETSLCALFTRQLELACLVCGHWLSRANKEADFLYGTACGIRVLDCARSSWAISHTYSLTKGRGDQVEPPEGDLVEPFLATRERNNPTLRRSWQTLLFVRLHTMRRHNCG